MERHEILELMGELSLVGMRHAYDEVMADGLKRQHAPPVIVGSLLKAEIAEKQARSIKYQMTIARMPLAKELADFAFADTPINEGLVRDLASGGFLASQRNVVLVGGTGTGKTHLATGLCLEACRQRRRVRFVTAAALVNELVEAKQNGQTRRMMARWQKYDLIAIDELGYVPLAEVGAEFLFQVISERAERAAWVVSVRPSCCAGILSV